MTGRLLGVGVGPGDPDLLTIKGRDALLDADVLFVPVSESSPTDGPGYAERVVRAHVPHATPITRLVFALGEHEREASWREAAARVGRVVTGGRTAALATIGDPNVYSTFTHLAAAVRADHPDVEVATVPGITAMQDLAARAGTVLLEHEERLTLLPLTAGPDRLREALADDGTVVLYKGGRHLPRVRDVLAEAGRLDHAVFGARLGLADEAVRDALPEGAAPYLSTVIVPARRPQEAP